MVQRARRHRRRVEVAAHVPHQERRIEFFERLVGLYPALAPDAERHHHLAQILTGGGEMIFDPVIGAPRLDDAGMGQFLQPFRQQRRRHARHAAPEIVEAAAAAHEFAKHQGGPAGADDFRSHRDRAKLAVAGR
jgi:hypothetical protein